MRVALEDRAPGPWHTSLTSGDLVYVAAATTNATGAGSTALVEIQALDSSGAHITPPPEQGSGCTLDPASIAGDTARIPFDLSALTPGPSATTQR